MSNNELSRQLFFDDFQAWQKQLQKLNTRGLLLISGSDTFISDTKKQLYSTLSVKEINSARSTEGPKKHINEILGNEFSHLFFDARSTFDTNLFALTSGALIGGGCLILCLPQGLSNDYQQLINHYLCADALNNQFHPLPSLANYNYSPVLKRLLMRSLNNSCTAIVTKNNYFFPGQYGNDKIYPRDQTNTQADLIQQIKRVATGHAKRPLVISASRGRGKSAALGIAAFQLLSGKRISIIVTAPTINNLTSFYKHLKSALPQGISKTTNNNFLFPNQSQLRFLPTDRILSEKPTSNLLLIDEAAAIPVPVLEQLTLSYNRIVFATTTHGYEGNGKGFNIRFKQKLLAMYPQTKFAELSTPMRWSIEDKLEKLYFQALLLNTNLHPVDETFPTPLSQLKFSVNTKQALTANETLLQQVFTLLIHAHYQTRPADLEQLLWNPKITTCSLTDANNTVIAVALVNKEGGLSKEQCKNIYHGHQRVKGDLLAQSLIVHHGQQSAGELAYYRIMRIAVHPSKNNSGVGSLLIRHIIKLAHKKAIDILGASFAADEKVVNFWLKNQFSVIRFGGAKDSSSGLYSCECITGLNNFAKKIEKRVTLRFNDALPYKLRQELRALSPSIIRSLYAYQLSASKQLTDNDRAELTQFYKNNRGLTKVDWLLERLLSKHLTQCRHNSKLAQNDTLLLVDLIIKQLPQKAVIEKYHFTGKKQLIKTIRKLTEKLLDYTQSI